MSRSTISTFRIFELFPNQEAAWVYLEKRLWPNGPTCPVCTDTEHITVRIGGSYHCNTCNFDFTVRTGTIFERSHIPLHKWIYVMYLMVTARKSVSSLQIAKEIGITQKSAWFMMHRITEACGDDITMLSGTVEIDEAYIGGKEANKHERKKLKMGRGTVGVNHSAGEYVKPDIDGDVSINGMESVWAVLKRGIHGTFHHISGKNTGRYVNEFTFRLNDGNVRRHTTKRLDSLVDGVAKRRITYKELIQK